MRTVPEPGDYRHGMWAATATMICRQAGEIDDVEYEILLKNLISRRDWAADKAAPYIHPRLSSIENKERSDHEGWLDIINEGVEAGKKV